MDDDKDQNKGTILLQTHQEKMSHNYLSEQQDVQQVNAENPLLL